MSEIQVGVVWLSITHGGVNFRLVDDAEPRLHLMRQYIDSLVPVLQRFLDTGKLEEPDKPKCGICGAEVGTCDCHHPVGYHYEHLVGGEDRPKCARCGGTGREITVNSASGLSLRFATREGADAVCKGDDFVQDVPCPDCGSGYAKRNAIDDKVHEAVFDYAHTTNFERDMHLSNRITILRRIVANQGKRMDACEEWQAKTCENHGAGLKAIEDLKERVGELERLRDTVTADELARRIKTDGKLDSLIAALAELDGMIKANGKRALAQVDSLVTVWQGLRDRLDELEKRIKAPEKKTEEKA